MRLLSDLKKRIVGDYKRGGVKGLYHWVRCHTWNRYHLIDIRGDGDYDWGWIDRCEAMKLACFKLLRDFVDNEDPRCGYRTMADYEYEGMGEHERREIQEQLDNDAEVRTLYDWWVYARKHDWESGRFTYRYLEEKDDEMLDRLMKVRKTLWT